MDLAGKLGRLTKDKLLCEPERVGHGLNLANISVASLVASDDWSQEGRSWGTTGVSLGYRRIMTATRGVRKSIGKLPGKPINGWDVMDHGGWNWRPASPIRLSSNQK